MIWPSPEGVRPMPIKALLYSADTPDQEPELGEVAVGELNERQLLWIDLVSPSEAELLQVAKQLEIEPALLQIGAGKRGRPQLSSYGHRFRLTATAAALPRAGQHVVPHWLTLFAGPNYVVSVHEGGIDFFEELREREKGDTGIGALSAESFVASLLDWLLNTYFQALELVVQEIDRVEVAILAKHIASVTPQLVEVLVQARRRISELRRLLIVHRDVFYGLARPDFMATETPESRPHFVALNARLERVEDDIDHSRELVVGAFEMLSMRAAQKTNDTMRALTFVTALLGSLALVAGVMGMNFEVEFFKSGFTGFAVVTGSMVLGTLVALAFAFWRRWI